MEKQESPQQVVWPAFLVAAMAAATAALLAVVGGIESVLGAQVGATLAYETAASLGVGALGATAYGVYKHLHG